MLVVNREQEIADEAARLKVAQDIADGEHRKKKKDGTGMDFDDSEEEEAYRKGNSEQRKEWRRKRKLDKMDPLDAVCQSRLRVSWHGRDPPHD